MKPSAFAVRSSALLLAAVIIVSLPCLSLVSCASGGGSAGALSAEYYAIAEGYAGIPKYDKAIEYYAKAARYPAYANAANYNLSRMYALSGKWAEACEILRELSRKEPDNAMISSAYAYSLASAGEPDKALAIYASLWARFPDDPQTGRNYAEILVIAGKYRDAIVCIGELTQKFPDADALNGIQDLQKKAEAALAPAPAATATAQGAVPAVPPPETPGASGGNTASR